MRWRFSSYMRNSKASGELSGGYWFIIGHLYAKLDKYMRKTKNAMTLMEIIVVIVLVGILSMAGVVGYRQTVLNARNREAQAMLRLIKHAAEVQRVEMNTYVGAACANTAACNVSLRLNLPVPAAGQETWIYSVPVATATNFCVQAAPGPLGAGAGFSIRRNVTTGLDEQDPVAGVCP